MAWDMDRTAIKMSGVANSDLSAKQFRFVKLVTGGDGDRVDVCSAVTDIPIGILQNKPKSGVEAEIMVAGISKISGDAALARGDLIGTSSDGQAATYVAGTDTTKYLVGQVLLAPAAAGNVGTATINCLNPHRGS